MKIKVGEVYNVRIEDCCVQGEFKSKLISIKIDEYNKVFNVNEAELFYGQELQFENGVTLYNEGGIHCNITK